MEYERDVDYTDETSGYDFLAEIDAILAEAEGDEEVAVDDTEVTVDGEENIDVDTTAEVDPNVKAVQDALTQAQAAAQKLGDKKLTDQIGNTITFFTRAHVVDKGAVAEGEDKELEEGVWSFLPERVPEFVKAVEELKDEYHGVVGSDDVYDGLDMAIRAAKELMNLKEAEGDTEKDTAETDVTDVTVDDTETIDTETTAEVDPNVKAVQDALTQAQAAAQKLGDKKLTDQIGNTITFFTRAHVVDKGAIAEGEEDVTSIGKKVETAVEDKLEATVSKLSDEQKDQLKAELAKLGVTATSNVKDVAAKLNESLYEAEGDTKAKVASALQDIGGGLMKSLLVPIIPVAIGSLGPGVAAGFAITAGVAGGLIALAKLLGAEKSMEEGKKEYYKDAEADDAEHIKALEKDIKADKKELEEGVWSFLPDRVPEFVKAVEELKDE